MAMQAADVLWQVKLSVLQVVYVVTQKVNCHVSHHGTFPLQLLYIII